MIRNIFFKYITGSSILVSGLLLTIFSFLLTSCFDDDNADELQKQQQEAFNKQLSADTVTIKQYLNDNNIADVKKTVGVIWYTEQVIGTGVQPQVGNRVRVNYALTLLDGTSMGSGPLDPFTLGSGAVVEGFDYSIRTMKVGGKSRFYIPSGLGYGASGRDPIQPNTILIFDIELLEAL